ncbi:MAG: carboxypeptidase regulatory-like domain-containing protein [Bacteroidetes bacterium]|nr:carboxypeptidase regulatory-like domain-containing protein [Bacteroidota bacterium]
MFSSIVTNYTFSGKVTYNNSANSPLANVTLKLTSSNSTVEASTNSTGDFQFNNLIPGTYQITLTTTNAWGGVNATDALRTVRVFANLDTFTDLQKKAGDVNNDGSINSTDALLMVRRFAGLISSFSIQDWVFDVPISITITTQNESVNIKALAAGDVDGSLIP